MIIKSAFIFIFLLSLLYIGKADITINGIANSQNGGAEIYSKFASEFNAYSEENNLGITLDVKLLSKDNSTTEVKDYESMLDALISKKSEKYDIYFYDNVFTPKFGPHFVDLKEKLPKEHIAMYEPSIASKSCVYKDKWVGLPITIDIAVLYYNSDLLTTYGKEVPKTWDELKETAKYIVSEEIKKDNEIVGYNGLFDGTEMGTCSLYEFIYTFRDEVDSPYPDYNSKEAIEALEMMKTLKEEIASDEIFKSSISYTYDRTSENKFLFVKAWYVPHKISANFTLIPGKKEGISGSTVGGYNVAINNYISDENKDAAVTVLKYITSKEIQKKMILSNKIFSLIHELYDDPEVCDIIDCSVLKNVQLTIRPSNIYSDYSGFSEMFRESIYGFLYGNKTSTKAMKDVSEIPTSSYIKKSYYGLLIYFIIYFIAYLFINF